jgi:hypothetical protein
VLLKHPIKAIVSRELAAAIRAEGGEIGLPINQELTILAIDDMGMVRIEGDPRKHFIDRFVLPPLPQATKETPLTQEQEALIPSLRILLEAEERFKDKLLAAAIAAQEKRRPKRAPMTPAAREQFRTKMLATKLANATKASVERRQGLAKTNMKLNRRGVNAAIGKMVGMGNNRSSSRQKGLDGGSSGRALSDAIIAEQRARTRQNSPATTRT